ncbi:MAG: cell division protein FtsZ [Rickettsiaceae bacterium 4572_127]|nr:MAG: cell division protein FtsZ [Rickettsiaceae bacterium 4572_127]
MMTEINLPKIAVIGVGGAGINIVKHMQELDLKGIDFIVANTDAQSLAHVENATKINLGKNITQGFGAGGDPIIGEKSAEESMDEIIEAISPYQMIFITAGMGGGTGSGAGSIIGKVAKDQGVLSVGIITRPFEFEGRKRTAVADEAIEKFRSSVDAYMILQNEKLFEIFDDDITQLEAFHKADELITNSLKGITDIIVSHGQINLDFADLRAILKDAGQIVLNSAIEEGEDRAKKVAESVLENPLLDQGNIAGANQVLMQISGGNDVKLKEIKEITSAIREHLPQFGNMIFGTNFKEEMHGKIHISLIAGGLNEGQSMPEKEDEKKTLSSFIFSKKTTVIPEKIEEKKEETISETTTASEDFNDLKKFFAFETETKIEEENKEQEKLKFQLKLKNLAKRLFLKRLIAMKKILQMNQSFH